MARKWSIRRTSVDVAANEAAPVSPAQEARRADQDEQDYSGRFGKPRHESGRVLRRAELHVRRHQKEAKRAEKLAAADASAGGSGGGSGPNSPSTTGLRYGLGRVRQVIVKPRYHQHCGGGNQAAGGLSSSGSSGVGSGQPLRQHLDYLARLEAQQEPGEVVRPEIDERAERPSADRLEVFFDAKRDVLPDTEVASLPARWQGDRHHWRIIVAPDLSPDERGELDLKATARGYIRRLEKVLDTPLEWAGAVHINTDHPHVHLLIRGRRRDGRDLVIKPEQIAYTLPAEARAEVVERIGMRDEQAADRALLAMAAKPRPTPLDDLLQQLSKKAGDKPFAVPADWLPSEAGRHHLVARLATLERLGMAERVTQPGRWWGTRDRWRLRPEWRGTLQRMGDQVAVEKSVRTPKAITTTTSVEPPKQQNSERKHESGVEL